MNESAASSERSPGILARAGEWLRHEMSAEPVNRWRFRLLVIACQAATISEAGAPDSSAVSVPEGAKAGDLILEPCEYPTETATTPPTAAPWSSPRNGPTRSRD